MFGIINFEAFVLAAVILNLTPGSDTMYILGRSVAQGTKAGIFSALGISTGVLVHCLFAVLGLSVILASSPLAFNLVKYAGAVYLIYLGLRMFLNQSKAKLDLQKDEAVSIKKIFTSGILTNVLNPKVALFFLAFLPQFINPGYDKSYLSFLILGLVFVLTSTIWCVGLAFYAAKFSGKVRENLKFKKWLDRVTGSVFILLGVKLALTEK